MGAAPSDTCPTLALCKADEQCVCLRPQAACATVAGVTVRNNTTTTLFVQFIPIGHGEHKSMTLAPSQQASMTHLPLINSSVRMTVQTGRNLRPVPFGITLSANPCRLRQQGNVKCSNITASPDLRVHVQRTLSSAKGVIPEYGSCMFFQITEAPGLQAVAPPDMLLRQLKGALVTLKFDDKPWRVVSLVPGSTLWGVAPSGPAEHFVIQHRAPDSEKFEIYGIRGEPYGEYLLTGWRQTSASRFNVEFVPADLPTRAHPPPNPAHVMTLPVSDEVANLAVSADLELVPPNSPSR